MHPTSFRSFVRFAACLGGALLCAAANAQGPWSQSPPADAPPALAAPTLPALPAAPPPGLPANNYQPLAPATPAMSPSYPPAAAPNNPPAAAPTYTPVVPSSPPAYTPYVPVTPAPYPPYTQIVPGPAPCLTDNEKFTESTWYAKFDYFHWNERFGGDSIVNEDGAFYTIGYQHQFGRERFRFEMFGGDVHYDGAVQFDDGTSEPLSSSTNYFGTRLEYDLLLQSDWTPWLNYIIGLGTRFWFRDLPDAVTASGTFATGYQETWWTVYPYIGIESKHDPNAAWEFYSSIKIGITAFTYQHVTLDDTQLYPGPGVTTDLEVGIRSKHYLFALALEEMSWSESPVSRDSVQPASTLFTVGLKAGYSF